MNTFQLKITSSSGCFYDGPCESLILPTDDGAYGIQANHESMVIGICIGEMRFLNENGWQSVILGQGYARSEDNHVTLVVDSAERPEDIDENRARAAKQRAEERLAVQNSRKEYYRGKLAMTRAMTRLKVKEKKYL
ncbi:putative ATP synthase F1, epsilon subunit [Marvinbryantia formatexigens DSM 14469]|uniref:ATP synthase epsilon chain n=1 Tax=Marvinbryantia formatexigens DSM 14469 TaxID=478749 RepID=C6LDU1_9FIRM|nr:ATP synthase F1 subunit epsilon [Marvinbryantia formatexigens]EET61145.1 putative ATP synthase F1, epsilon subunit [Marvinbryantia formatexigens DSM 14469]UWO23717.1 ATP synthase F1 subunit epsilon [Marvinbryantia formatexigens DSM 14469]SDF67672.1 ATP synthase F1 subcomplex epsilon subunit [Marvinbryantia formatexigens]